jgi:phytoene dehydrogenase-like protein
MTNYDALIIGAGHNGLICAGYLAKAGYKVAVVERRPIVGGAVVTEEHVPGFKFDLGGSGHMLINSMPVIDDLNLHDYGLEYIDCDPIFFAPFPDGSHLFMYRSIEKTCESIAQISQHDADAYYEFIQRWTPLSKAMLETFKSVPTPWNLFRKLIMGAKFGRKWQERLNVIIRSYGHVIQQTFESPQMQGFMAWVAAQSGPPPGEAFTAPFALWHPLYHEGGLRRPKGGSGMLTQAIAKMVEAHGGDIVVDQPVVEILVENGAAVGVKTMSGEQFMAKKVIAASHVHTTMRMLGDNAPAGMRERVEQTRIGNGFGAIVRFAIHELPNYSALPSPADGSPGPQHIAMQMISPDIPYLERAYGDFLAMQPSREPSLISMTFSAVDPSLAPENKHTLFLWGQYYPYELANGETWDNIAQRERDRMLHTLAKYAPNMTEDNVIGELIETPEYLERTLGLLRGNVMHLEMTLDQMMAMRPVIGMSNYRGPLKHLYITGASTHPGGGIMGASGRNAAHVVLRDIERRR